jgi:hypothetical protein
MGYGINHNILKFMPSSDTLAFAVGNGVEPNISGDPMARYRGERVSGPLLGYLLSHFI